MEPELIDVTARLCSDDSLDEHENVTEVPALLKMLPRTPARVKMSIDACTSVSRVQRT